MADTGLPATLLETHLLRERDGVRLLLRRDWESALPVDAMLAGAPLPAWGRPVPHTLSGRGAMHVFATPHGEIVAKRLLRGGAAGALLRGWFADARRPLREAESAERLLARGCRTAPVVAVRTTRGPAGLHRLEIATARVPAEGELVAVLQARPSRLPRLAADAGRTLRRLHDAGLRHRDLNARNLLVPPDGGNARQPEPSDLIVIDLDRCSVGAPLDVGERVASLARLARSLMKQGVLPLRRGERVAEIRACRAFFAGYGACGTVRRAVLLASVAAHVRRTLPLHPWSWLWSS